MECYSNISEAIGNTPIIKIKNTPDMPTHCNIYAKLEFLNPGGSIKDRLVRYILNKLADEGKLGADSTIIENSSGNTGAAISMMAASYGYRSVITIPDKMSEEKISRMRAFGSDVMITPTDVEADDPRSYYSLAKQLAEEDPNAIYPDQYNNPLNAQAHYHDTAPELWEQTHGEIDVFICGIGTGGTISGVGKYLKERNPDIKIIGVDPYGSVFHDYFYHGELPTPNLYSLEGIGEDYLVKAIDFSVIDEIEQVADEESFLAARELARNDGILCGGSSGSAYCVAKRLAPKFKDKNIVMLLPDSGNMYLSKFLNDDWMQAQGYAIDAKQLENGKIKSENTVAI